MGINQEYLYGREDRTPKPAWLSSLALGPGMHLYPHQIEAVDFSLTRENSYLGLDPGLGKSIVAAVISSLRGPPVLVVTPPFLIANLTAEFSKWAPHLRLAVIGKKPINLGTSDVLFIPDSIITRDAIHTEILSFVRMWGECESTIIVDEAHRFKNEKSKRSSALFCRLSRLFDKRLFMSGTPMPNRPMELFPILSRFAPETINRMPYFEFGKRYCAGFKTRFGWDFTGASNVKELGQRVIHPTGPFMLRIKKNRLNLPPKIEELFIISNEMTPQLASMEKKISKSYASEEDLIKHAIVARRVVEEGSGEEGEDIHIATYRHQLALEKVKPVAEYIDVLLSETDESLLVFGLHIEAIDELSKALSKYKPFVITGKTPMKRRQEYVSDFQTSGSSRRLFMGNITAMGVGFTLTKATRVIFFEFSWVPGENDQASDRAHRIGQRDTVFVQYVVYKDSIDKRVIEALTQKRKSMRFI